MSKLVMRTATIDDADAQLAADVMTAAYPALEQDPVITKLRWENTRAGFSAGRFIGELDGRPIAFLAWVHGPWEKLPERHCEVEVWLDRAAMDRELLGSMWSWIAEGAVADGARLLLAYAAEDELEALDVLAELGYERDRVERVWELDLREHGERLAAQAREARAEMTGSGIRFTTLAEWQDPARLQKLHELTNVTVQDVPHTLPIIEETYQDFERRIDSPDRPHDRFWIACSGDRPVAYSYLKFPPVRGGVWTGYTCTDPGYRGRGIARAVKLQGLEQAVALGVPFVYTDNDSENAPMLHINEVLGYRRRPGFVSHLKRVDRKRDA